MGEDLFKKVGAVENSFRGVWSLTKAGEKLTSDDVRSIPARVRKQLIDDRRAKEVAIASVAEKRAKELDPPEMNPATALDADEVEATEPHWKDQLLGLLRTLRPDAFERLAQRLLREAGFLKVEVTGRSGDGGIDGIGVLRANLLSFQVLFQCKRYRGSVGRAPSVISEELWSGVPIKGFLLRPELSRLTQSVRQRGTVRRR